MLGIMAELVPALVIMYKRLFLSVLYLFCLG